MALFRIRWLKWLIAILLFLVILAIIVGVSAVSYGNGIAFVYGIPLTLLIGLFVWFCRYLWQKGHKTLVIVLGSLLFVAANVALTLVFAYPYAPFFDTLKSRILSFSKEPSEKLPYYARSRGMDSPDSPVPSVRITEYVLSITPTDSTLETFQIKGNLRLVENGKEQLLTFTQQAEVKSVPSNQGWLLREVALPLPERILPQFTWKDEGVTKEAQDVCCFRPVRVSVQDFPKGAFYEAKDAAKLEQTRYGKNETIEWLVYDPWGEAEELHFTFLPPPYHQFAFLHRFAALSSVADWVLTVCGMLGSSILVALIVPVLKDFGKGKVKGAMNRALQQKAGSPEGPPQEITEEGIPDLARYLAARLSPDQFARLRKEIDSLLTLYKKGK